jgi:tRNA-dependent cyclodipeptide synthase
MPPATAPTSHDSCPQMPEPFVYEHRGAHGLEGRLRILPRRHTRALRTGLDLLPARPLAVLGFSPGNAFFTRKRVEIAVCAMARLFGEVAVVIPDTIAVHTYRALGYNEKQSYVKARENGLNLKNRCLRAIERVRAESPTADVRILDWDRDVASLPGYSNAYARVSALFDANERFRNDVLDKGYSVLGAKLGRETVTYAAAREGVEYLLKELAYFTLFRSTFGRDVVVPYHQDFRLGQSFCDGGYQDPLPGIGWLIYDIDVPSDDRSGKEARDASQV